MMDYSLLVGIHDPSIPHDDKEENKVDEYDEQDDEGSGLSGDELEPPHSPSSVTGYTLFVTHRLSVGFGSLCMVTTGGKLCIYKCLKKVSCVSNFLLFTYALHHN